MQFPEKAKPIDKLYAVLAVDKDGNEGIVGFDMGGNNMQAVTSNPLIAARMAETTKAIHPAINPKEQTFVIATFERKQSFDVD